MFHSLLNPQMPAQSWKSFLKKLDEIYHMSIPGYIFCQQINWQFKRWHTSARKSKREKDLPDATSMDICLFFCLANIFGHCFLFKSSTKMYNWSAKNIKSHHHNIWHFGPHTQIFLMMMMIISWLQAKASLTFAFIGTSRRALSIRTNPYQALNYQTLILLGVSITDSIYLRSSCLQLVSGVVTQCRKRANPLQSFW